MSGSTTLVPANTAAIARAAEILRGGGLVAFPTETVYGLGANALDAAAVSRVFAAKGRPASNPVIVHVAAIADVAALVRDLTELAKALMARFWPGPLTCVLPRRETVPDIVAAGGPTVAVRMPAHPVALELIRAAGVPLAAPSANRSMCLSPTRAEHVLRSLDGRVDLILDGGPCPGGLESTVLDVTTSPPTLLRPGLIGVGALERIVGPVARRSNDTSIARSPGLSPRHYSPRTPVEFVADEGSFRVRELASAGRRVGWLAFGDHAKPPADNVVALAMPTDVAAYSTRLFAALHELDDANVSRIVISLPPEDDDWLAVHDRLSRMAPH
jgi:L-threonylcarbamoyladenylate synthase